MFGKCENHNTIITSNYIKNLDNIANHQIYQQYYIKVVRYMEKVFKLFCDENYVKL